MRTLRLRKELTVGFFFKRRVYDCLIPKLLPTALYYFSFGRSKCGVDSSYCDCYYLDRYNI